MAPIPHQLDLFTQIVLELRREEFNPFAGPKPVVVLVQFNPWGMVLGADTPNVVLYEDGLVIYLKRIKKRYLYYSVRLDRAGLDRVLERVKPLLALKEVKARYDLAPNVTDQPEAMLYVRSDQRTIASRVYGLSDSISRRGASTVMGNSKKVDAPPKELLELHRWLCTLDFAGGKPWTPRYIEVMLWDFSHARKSVAWPKDLPQLDSPRTIRRRDAYSLFLDANQLPKLQKLISSLGESTAVKIQGKKLSIQTRDTFPSEPEWRKAFQGGSKS